MLRGMSTASETPVTTAPEPSYTDLTDPPAAAVEEKPAEPAAESPADTAEPEDAEPEPEPRWTHPDPEKWEHDWLDFHGDRLAFRPPSRAAMTGFYLKQVGKSPIEQIMVMDQLLSKHLSPASYERVQDASMDPDVGYPDEAIDELIGLMTEPTKDAAEAAAAEAEKAK